MKKGANVNCRLDEKGFTPLMLASEGPRKGQGLYLGQCAHVNDVNVYAYSITQYVNMYLYSIVN